MQLIVSFTKGRHEYGFQLFWILLVVCELFVIWKFDALYFIKIDRYIIYISWKIEVTRMYNMN